VRGRNIETGDMSVVRITPEGVGSGRERWQGVYNPSFDVTPAELISEWSEMDTTMRRAACLRGVPSESVKLMRQAAWLLRRGSRSGKTARRALMSRLFVEQLLEWCA
jgi:hypothetical protein